MQQPQTVATRMTTLTAGDDHRVYRTGRGTLLWREWFEHDTDKVQLGGALHSAGVGMATLVLVNSGVQNWVICGKLLEVTTHRRFYWRRLTLHLVADEFRIRSRRCGVCRSPIRPSSAYRLRCEDAGASGDRRSIRAIFQRRFVTK